MDEGARQPVADRFLSKYGKPIDCQALAEVASLKKVNRERLRLANARMLTEFADFLGKLDNDLRAFLDRQMPGTKQSMLDVFNDAAAAKTGSAPKTVSISDS